MNTSAIIPLAIILLLFTKCSGCDEFGEYLGTRYLTEESKTSYPSRYESLTKVRFSNESNDVMSYDVLNSQGYLNTKFEKTGVCDTEPYDGVFNYYETEEISTTLAVSDRDFLSIRLHTVVYEDQVVDVLEVVRAKNYTTINRINLVLSLGNSSILHSVLEEFDTLYNELSIRGRIFNNVYESSQESDLVSVFYALEMGIVAIKDGDEMWLVEE